MPLLLPAVLVVTGFLAIVGLARVSGGTRRNGSTVNPPTPRPRGCSGSIPPWERGAIVIKNPPPRIK